MTKKTKMKLLKQRSYSRQKPGKNNEVFTLPDRLQTDLSWCENLIKEHSSSFYNSFRLLPKPQAAAIFAIYAFCRIADDAVDVHNNPLILDIMEEKLEQFRTGYTPEEPLWRLLRWSFDTFTIDIKPFFEMIEGQRRDVNFTQPVTLEALDEYCYYVAGTVGLMILPVLSRYVTPELQQTSVNLGKAMQLTNILRDIASDFKAGRIYLPVKELNESGICNEDLGKTEPSYALKRLWLKLAQKSIIQYKGAEKNIRLFDPPSRLPVLLALLYYRQITLLGMKNSGNIISKRIIVPKWLKYVLVLKAHLKLLFV